MQEIERVAYAKGRRDGYREGIIAVVSIVLADNSGVLAEEPKAECEKEKK